MRAFKKLMAGAIAMAIAATMATSAFAAEASFADGKVTVTGFEATAEQTTVLIVPAENWETDKVVNLEDEDIFYINQYDSTSEANTAIAAGFGVKLDEDGTLGAGNYYALFGGTDEITAVPFEVTAASTEPDEPDTPVTKTIQLGDCDGAEGITPSDGAAVLNHFAGITLLTGDNLIAADCDGAEGITPSDGAAILNHFAGLITLGTVTITE